MVVKHETISSQSQGTTFTVITLNRESNCTRRKKNHSQFHHDFFDVARTTRTTLETMVERRIDDYWNIERNRDLSDSWTGFTRFTILDGRETSKWENMVRDSGSQRNRRHPGRTTRGQRYGKTCQKRRSEEKSRNRSLTTTEDCAVLTSLIQRMSGIGLTWNQVRLTEVVSLCRKR